MKATAAVGRGITTTLPFFSGHLTSLSGCGYPKTVVGCWNTEHVLRTMGYGLD